MCHSGLEEPAQSPVFPANRMFFTSTKSMAASGNRLTMDGRGTQSSTASLHSRFGQSRFRRRILRLFSSPAAKVCSVRIYLLEMGYTNPSMPAKPGLTLDFARASRFPLWRSILAIQTGFLPPCSATLMERIRNVEFSARLMAARRGRRSYTKTKTQADRTWRSIPRILKSFTRRYGNHGSGHGRTTTRLPEPEGDFSNPPTAEIPGRSWREDYRR